MGNLYVNTKKPVRKIARTYNKTSGIIRIDNEACDVLEGILNELNDTNISVCSLASTMIISCAEQNIIKKREIE